MSEWTDWHASSRSQANVCKRRGMVLVAQRPRCQQDLSADGDVCGSCGLALTPKAQIAWFQRASVP